MQDIERMLKRRLLVGATTPGEALEAHLARSCGSPRSLVAKTFRLNIEVKRKHLPQICGPWKITIYTGKLCDANLLDIGWL